MEEIDVARLQISARVLDGRGDPLPDLGPEDFRLQVGGQELPVLAVDWISSSNAAGSVDPLAPGRFPAPSAREDYDQLVVYFIQADHNSVRIEGHLRMLDHTEEMIASLGPRDLAAVVSFDSHFKLWQDFTCNARSLQEAIERAVRFTATAPVIRPGRPPSIARHFHPEDGRDDTSPEQALLTLAEALAPIEGEKAVVYLGWGLGTAGSSALQGGLDYRPAVRALLKARASVFVLDVTQADWHSLGQSLRNLARHTGGTYMETFRRPLTAARHLVRTLSGHYILTIDRDALPPGGGKLEIELRGRRGTVLHPDIHYR